MQSKLVFFFNEISRKPFFRDTNKSIITLFPVSFSSPSYSSLPPSPFPQLSFSLLFPSFPLFSLTFLCLPSLSSLLPSLPFLFFFFFLAYVVTFYFSLADNILFLLRISYFNPCWTGTNRNNSFKTKISFISWTAHGMTLHEAKHKALHLSQGNPKHA